MIEDLILELLRHRKELMSARFIAEQIKHSESATRVALNKLYEHGVVRPFVDWEQKGRGARRVLWRLEE